MNKSAVAVRLAIVGVSVATGYFAGWCAGLATLVACGEMLYIVSAETSRERIRLALINERRQCKESKAEATGLRLDVRDAAIRERALRQDARALREEMDVLRGMLKTEQSENVDLHAQLHEEGKKRLIAAVAPVSPPTKSADRTVGWSRFWRRDTGES